MKQVLYPHKNAKDIVTKLDKFCTYFMLEKEKVGLPNVIMTYLISSPPAKKSEPKESVQSSDTDDDLTLSQLQKKKKPTFQPHQPQPSPQQTLQQNVLQGPQVTPQ
ncbi:hypothetical protein RJT34_20157 [Clitoria ternatea]|uniref:Uncharacterized protein n=1 Tax=Clitoria ternatea TaxID=43366 RepID=A0AAN9ISU4_CLITE